MYDASIHIHINAKPYQKQLTNHTLITLQCLVGRNGNRGVLE